MSSTTGHSSPTSTSAADAGSGTAQTSAGISIVAFFTALASSLIIFGVQMGFFLLLRNKLARIL
jgi:calcium permeable stress-gated cation channel